MGVVKPKFLEHLLGVEIAGVVARGQALRADLSKREGNDCLGSLYRESSTPILRPQMEA
jgi:hypothetical protein